MRVLGEATNWGVSKKTDDFWLMAMVALSSSWDGFLGV